MLAGLQKHIPSHPIFTRNERLLTIKYSPRSTRIGTVDTFHTQHRLSKSSLNHRLPTMVTRLWHGNPPFLWRMLRWFQEDAAGESHRLAMHNPTTSTHPQNLQPIASCMALPISGVLKMMSKNWLLMDDGVNSHSDMTRGRSRWHTLTNGTGARLWEPDIFQHISWL